MSQLEFDFLSDIELETDEMEAWNDLMNDREGKWEDPNPEQPARHYCMAAESPMNNPEDGFKSWNYCKTCGKWMSEFNGMRKKLTFEL